VHLRLRRCAQDGYEQLVFKSALLVRIAHRGHGVHGEGITLMAALREGEDSQEIVAH
jgi:hypothetical protein